MTPEPSQQSEIAALKAAVNELTAHMSRSLPEERVKALVETATTRDRVSRRRVTWVIVGLVGLAVLISGFGLAQSESNGDALDEIRVISNFVEDCLQHPERLTPEERTEKCGGNDQDGRQLIMGLIQFQKCSLLILPEDRTDANLDACIQRALNQ